MAKNKSNHNQFFLSFFTEDRYEVKEINGWYLIKHWDGNTGKYRADLYSVESYNNFLRGKQKYQEAQDQLGFIRGIRNEV